MMGMVMTGCVMCHVSMLGFSGYRCNEGILMGVVKCVVAGG